MYTLVLTLLVLKGGSAVPLQTVVEGFVKESTCDDAGKAWAKSMKETFGESGVKISTVCMKK
jgi:hypothetical protein